MISIIPGSLLEKLLPFKEVIFKVVTEQQLSLEVNYKFFSIMVMNTH